MAEEASEIRYYVDASMISIGRALALIRRDVTHPGHASRFFTCPIKAERTNDHEWLPVVGEAGWVVILRDKRIRSRALERRALRDAGVLGICLTGSGNSSNWAMLNLIVRQWPAIESIASTAKRPGLFSLTTQGLRELCVEDKKQSSH